MVETNYDNFLRVIGGFNEFLLENGITDENLRISILSSAGCVLAGEGLSEDISIRNITRDNSLVTLVNIRRYIEFGHVGDINFYEDLTYKIGNSPNSKRLDSVKGRTLVYLLDHEGILISHEEMKSATGSKDPKTSVNSLKQSIYRESKIFRIEMSRANNSPNYKILRR